MACAGALAQAQSPMPCQLCEESFNIQWKCLQCDRLMCTNCKNTIHQKFNTDGKYDIIDIKEVASQSNQGIEGIANKFELSVINKYSTKLSMVCFIETNSDDNSLWIGTGSSRKLFYFSAPKALQKVAIERNKLKIKSSFNIMVYNIAMTSDNDLLVVTDGPRLKQINSKTGILEDSKYSVDPALQPTFVHITRDNSKVIIGLCGIHRKYAVLIVMDKDGQHQEMVLDHDKDNQYQLTYPASITSTSTNSICVVDLKSMNSDGRVVILDQEYNVVNIFEHERCNLNIVTTPLDNIIVSCCDNHKLFILNSSGYPITIFNTMEIGIICPYVLAFNKKGELYIGCTTAEYGPDKANIYKLNITGC